MEGTDWTELGVLYGQNWMKLHGHNWTDLGVLKYTNTSLVDLETILEQNWT